jgi:biotin synthase
VTDVLGEARDRCFEAGMLRGINAIIVGNYFTTLGRPARADLEMPGRLRMPIKALSGTL